MSQQEVGTDDHACNLEPSRTHLSAIEALSRAESQWDSTAPDRRRVLTDRGYADFVAWWCSATSRSQQEAPRRSQLDAMLQRLIFSENALVFAEAYVLEEAAHLRPSNDRTRRGAVVEIIGACKEELTDLAAAHAESSRWWANVVAESASESLQASRVEHGRKVAADGLWLRVIILRRARRALALQDDAFGDCSSRVFPDMARVMRNWKRYGPRRLAAELSTRCGAFYDDTRTVGQAQERFKRAATGRH